MNERTQRKIPAKAPTLKVHHGQKTMLQRLGWRRLVALVWQSTPFPIRLISLPYGVAVYRTFLTRSETLEEVRVLHSRKYKASRVFRKLRPRFRQAKYLLI